MSHIRITSFAILLFIGFNGFAQNRATIDSLKNLLQFADNDSLKAHLFNELGWNYRADSPKLGFEFGMKALNIYEAEKNILKQCNVLNKLGINKRNTGEYSAALDNFFKILTIAERPLCTLEIAYANNNIADIYSRLERYDKALEFTNKALPLFKAADNQMGISYNYNQTGTIYQNLKNWNQALKFFKMSIDLRLKMNDISGAASSYINIGDCYLELYRPDSALTYYKKGMAYYDKAGFSNYGHSYISLGKYYLSRKEYQEAIKYLNEAIVKARLTKNPSNIRKANEILHKIYFQMKDYKKAYEVQKLARQDDEMLLKSDYIKKITTLELNLAFEQQVKQNEIDAIKKTALYESHLFKQKILLLGLILLLIVISIITFIIYKHNKNTDKTNLLLKKYNKKISRQKIAIESQNQQLQELNATKDKFFSIIAHDLKNPFYGIFGMSEHIVNSYPNSSYEETISLVEIIRDSSQNAFDLLENLLEWSKAQTGRLEFNPEYFAVDQLLNGVAGLLINLSKQKKISINFHVDKSLELYADQNMIQTVMRNLISNAIKFTETNGEINVFAVHEDEEAKITVSDNGIGMSEKTKEKLFKISEKISSLGTDNEKGTGLGLLLCKEFVEKHGGKIGVVSELGKGTDVHFTIPVHQK